MKAALMKTSRARRERKLRMEELESRNLFAWSHLGPTPLTDGDKYYGGRVNSIVAFENDGFKEMVLGTGGGIWSSNTFDTTAPSATTPWWRIETDSISGLYNNRTGLGSNRLAIGALAFDPNDPNKIYAGTGYPALAAGDNFGGYGGTGMLVSTNGGVTWSMLATGLGTGGAHNTTEFWHLACSAIVVDPRPGNGNQIWAAFTIEGQGPSTLGGLFFSKDSGKTWAKQNSGPAGSYIGDNIRVTDLDYRYNPGSAKPLILFAGVVSSVPTLSGVYKSDNDGANWAMSDAGPSSGHPPTANQPYKRVLLATPQGDKGPKRGSDTPIVAAFVQATGQTRGHRELVYVVESKDGGNVWAVRPVPSGTFQRDGEATLARNLALAVDNNDRVWINGQTRGWTQYCSARFLGWALEQFLGFPLSV